MNICESHQLGVSCDTEDAEGSRGVSGGPAQGGDVGATMETQCPVEDRPTDADTGSSLSGHSSAYGHASRPALATWAADVALVGRFQR